MVCGRYGRAGQSAASHVALEISSAQEPVIIQSPRMVDRSVRVEKGRQGHVSLLSAQVSTVGTHVVRKGT